MAPLPGLPTAPRKGFFNNSTVAQFNQPTGITADSNNNLIITDKLNYALRKVNTTGFVTTIAGNGTNGYLDGLGLSHFNFSHTRKLWNSSSR